MLKHKHQKSGFSLIELLVVISVLTLLMGLVFPLLGALRSSNILGSGVTIVSSAVASARSYIYRGNTKVLPDVRDGSSKGAAAVITANDIFFVVHDPAVRLGSNTSGQFAILTDYLGYTTPAGANAPLKLPAGVGVAGLVREGTNRLLAPPFAVRFDENGNLIVSDIAGTSQTERPSYVLVDGDGNGSFPASPAYRNNYDPEAWDESSEDFVTANENNLPFDMIESVPAVIVFNKIDFLEQFPNGWPDGGSVDAGSAQYTWITENGRILWFSRHSGVVSREGSQQQN